MPFPWPVPESKSERYFCFLRRTLQGIIVTPSFAASLSGDSAIRSQATNGGQNFSGGVGKGFMAAEVEVDVDGDNDVDSDTGALDRLSRDGLG